MHESMRCVSCGRKRSPDPDKACKDPMSHFMPPDPLTFMREVFGVDASRHLFPSKGNDKRLTLEKG